MSGPESSLVAVSPLLIPTHRIWTLEHPSGNLGPSTAQTAFPVPTHYPALPPSSFLCSSSSAYRKLTEWNNVFVILAKLSLNIVTSSWSTHNLLKLNVSVLMDSEKECFFRKGKAEKALHRKIDNVITA